MLYCRRVIEGVTGGQFPGLLTESHPDPTRYDVADAVVVVDVRRRFGASLHGYLEDVHSLGLSENADVGGTLELTSLDGPDQHLLGLVPAYDVGH